jgi:hypothetical protein
MSADLLRVGERRGVRLRSRHPHRLDFTAEIGDDL